MATFAAGWAIRDHGESGKLSLTLDGVIVSSWPMHPSLGDRRKTINNMRRRAEELAGGELNWERGPFPSADSASIDEYRALNEVVPDVCPSDEWAEWRDLAS